MSVGQSTHAARQVLAAAINRTPQGMESRIAGTSMEPAIPDGATIRILPQPDGGYREGMVVACLSAGNRLFAHRIVRAVCLRNEDFVLTTGDGWLLCDPPTAVGNVVGIVSAYRVDQDWMVPPIEAPRGLWQAVLSRSSMWLVLSALLIHPIAARYFAGSCLNVGSWIKSLRRHAMTVINRPPTTRNRIKR